MMAMNHQQLQAILQAISKEDCVKQGSDETYRTDDNESENTHKIQAKEVMTDDEYFGEDAT